MRTIKLILFVILVLLNFNIIAQNDTIKTKLTIGFTFGNDLTFNIIEKNNYTTSVKPRYGFRAGVLITSKITKKNNIELGLLFCSQEIIYKSNFDFIYPDKINPLYGPIFQTASQITYFNYPLGSSTSRNSSLLLSLSSIHYLFSDRIYISPSMIMNFWLNSKIYYDNKSVPDSTTYYNFMKLKTDDKYINHCKIGFGIRIGYAQKFEKFIFKYEPNFVYWNLVNFGNQMKNNYFYSIGLNLIVMINHDK